MFCGNRRRKEGSQPAHSTEEWIVLHGRRAGRGDVTGACETGGRPPRFTLASTVTTGKEGDAGSSQDRLRACALPPRRFGSPSHRPRSRARTQLCAREYKFRQGRVQSLEKSFQDTSGTKETLPQPLPSLRDSALFPTFAPFGAASCVLPSAAANRYEVARQPLAKALSSGDPLTRRTTRANPKQKSPSALTTQMGPIVYAGCRYNYTHSSAPFFQIQMYPTIRMPRKIIISSKPNKPSSLNCTAHGNRKMVSTSKTTNRMATI